jgi:hypothetical protein
MHGRWLMSLPLMMASLGCSTSTGSMPQATGTAVTLSQSNYRVLKAGAKGESAGFSLLGLIPIVSPSYAEAKSDLYGSIGHGLEGKPIALANQTQDAGTTYLLLFSIPRLIVTADVVEFTDSGSAAPSD